MFKKNATPGHSKPAGSFRLNDSHPLARSLVLCIPFNDFAATTGSGREIWTRDLGIIKSTSEQATPKYSADRFGLWGSFEKSVPDGFLIENLPSTFPCISSTQPFTALAWLAKSGQVTGDAYNVIKRDDNVANNDSILYLKDNDTIGCTHGGIDFASTATIANDEPGLVGSLWDGATSRLIVKGARSGSAAVSALNSGITVLRIAHRIDLSVTRAYKGPLYVIYIFDRALEEVETLDLHYNPFSLFSMAVPYPAFKRQAVVANNNQNFTMMGIG